MGVSVGDLFVVVVDESHYPGNMINANLYASRYRVIFSILMQHTVYVDDAHNNARALEVNHPPSDSLQRVTGKALDNAQ